MLVGFSLSLTFTLWFFTPSTLSSRMGTFLPRTSGDSYAFVTVGAIRLSRNWIDKPTVVALGSSTTEQALGDGRYFKEEIKKRNGSSWGFISLAAARQNPLDQIVLLETALLGHEMDSPPILILISASWLRMTWTVPRMLENRETRRIGLRSSWTESLLAGFATNSIGNGRWTTGVYAIDNPEFVCLKGTVALMRVLTGRPVTRNAASYSKGNPLVGEDRVMRQVTPRYSKALENAEVYLEIQRRFIKKLRIADNVHIVLVDEPFAPDALEAHGMVRIAQAADQRIARFATETGVEYWTPAADAAFTAEDFHDALHIKTGKPQERIQEALARYVAEYARQGDL